MCETVVLDAGESRPGSVSAAVVSGIATVEDVDPMELDVCLADHVDPDAVEALLAHGTERSVDTELRFTVGEYEVVAAAPGDVAVSRRCDVPEQCDAAIA